MHTLVADSVLYCFRPPAKVARTTAEGPRVGLLGATQALTPAAAGQSSDWQASIQAIVQQQQQPLWNTLSLQMAQNRQMQEGILALPQLLMQSPAYKQFANPPPQNIPQPVQSHQAPTPAADSPENIAENHDNYDYYEELSGDESAAHVSPEHEDFESFSQYADAAKPLTLVERLEKLYIRLPHLTPPPRPTVPVVPSVRDSPEIEGRVRSLPAPAIILDTFQRFRETFRRQEGAAPVVDEVTGEIAAVQDDIDYSARRKALTPGTMTKKSDLQFQVHSAAHAPYARLDSDHQKFFPDYAAKTFKFTMNQVQMIQTASSYSLDACCHMDALLLGVRKCLEATQAKIDEFQFDTDEEYDDTVSDLHEALEYLQSLSFAEDFIIKKNVWIFSSLSAFMRESMLSTVRNLDPELAAWLKHLPFNAGRLYNK